MSEKSPLMRIADSILGGQISNLEEAVELYGAMAFTGANNNGILQERIAELEFALEDAGWAKLSAEKDGEMSKSSLDVINRMARVFWLKNPLVKRAVYTQTAYVFGQGMSVKAVDTTVDELIQAFMDDTKNQAELTSHQARMQKETELQLEANIFFVFFSNIKDGRTRIRSIPPAQIVDILCNPQDSKEPWYYKRVWEEPESLGSAKMVKREALYPDFRYNPKGGHPATAAGIKVLKEPVYHVKVNCLSDMKFGVSEVYAAIDWARAYKDFLEDWATLVRSLSRFAWKATSKSGAKGIEAAKEKLNSTITAGNPLETNLPPAAGSVFMSNEAFQLDPIAKTGATTSVEDGRRMLLMVSAATGIFEHYFGDPSTGNLATATAMERPMELMFKDRQTLWADVHQDIFQFIIDSAAVAPGGSIRGTVKWDDYGERFVDTGELDRSIEVSFPDILEKDVAAKVTAIVSAATLDGKTPANTVDLKTITRMLLVALGENDADELLTKLFPDEVKPWTQVEEEQAAKNAEKIKQQQELMKATAGAAPAIQKAEQEVEPEPEEKPVPAAEALFIDAVEKLTQMLESELEDAEQ